METEKALQKIEQHNLIKKDLNFWLKGRYLTMANDTEKKKLFITFPDKTSYTTSSVENYDELVASLQTRS